MKQLILVRHAKSSWSDLLIADKDRPLNSRGKRDAPIMAEKLKQLVPEIDAFFVSTAKRAQKTAKKFYKLYSDAIWTNVDDIYEAYVDDLEDVVYSISDDINQAVLFGHNPGFTMFANKYQMEFIDNLPTCGIVIIEFSGKNWSTFHPTNAQVKEIIYPKMYT